MGMTAFGAGGVVSDPSAVPVLVVPDGLVTVWVVVVDPGTRACSDVSRQPQRHRGFSQHPPAEREARLAVVEVVEDLLQRRVLPELVANWPFPCALRARADTGSKTASAVFASMEAIS